MYKLLLVDDNRAFLESFYMLVDWAKYGFEVAARLGDGSEVLEFIKNNHVDAIITDIKMTEIDGTELAKEVYENYPGIKIAFFSAFRDFKYATEAIKYGVVAYICKPIMLDQLEEGLEKLYASVEEKRSSNSGEIIDLQVVLRREELFCKWLYGERLNNDYLKEELANVNILYQSVYSKCALATFGIFGIERKIEANSKHDRENLYEAITKVACVDTPGYHAVRLNFTDGKLTLLYIGKYSNAITKQCASTVIENLQTIFGLTAVDEYYYEFNSLSELKEAVSGAKKTELKYLRNQIELRGDRQMLDEVERYINEHYGEDISIELVANHCHFNEQYFGKLFKKMTGKKFVDYLNEIRIEKAKPMLASGDSVESVCGKIGYGSRRHFDKQFQRYTGETPAQYRKNKMERK